MWEQHRRYFRKQGILYQDSQDLFDEHMLADLRKWRAGDKEIILMGYLNQNIYTSQFATYLAAEDLGLKQQY